MTVSQENNEVMFPGQPTYQAEKNALHIETSSGHVMKLN
jgi:hypothetical protein